ncbi:MAG: hypothetical protein Q9172_001300 [Xanthocarpia lactea]
MPSKWSSRPQIALPDTERGTRSSWRQKLRWPSRSREPPTNRTQRESSPYTDPSNRTDIHWSDIGRNPAASADVEPESTITAPPPPILSENVHVNDDLQAKDSIAVGENDTVAYEPTDLWSAAYREAFSSLGEEEKSMISKGESIEKLFMTLEKTNEEFAGDSLFRRGLRRLQAPLTNIKLALDIASPLAAIEPTASTAVGVVQSVTAVAIAICGAEEELNARIVTMLDHVAIIDECDILGQKLDAGNVIHKALVLVYKDLLSFYMAAHKILTSQSFVLAIVSDQFKQRLSTIVSGFLGHAESLRYRIDNATSGLVADIKQLLQDNKNPAVETKPTCLAVQKLLGANKDKQRSEVHSRIRGLRAIAACEWIAADSKFLEWYKSPASEQLVIFGDMGCGKTTIAAHVIEELIHLNKHRLPRPLLCYHYCVDNETGNVLYIYSSLILQLLDQLEALKIEFNKWYDDTKKTEFLDAAQSSINLGDFFSKCVETLNRDLFVVIDGLDECDTESQEELVTLLNSLLKKTPRLKVFFSSRPQEGIKSLLQGSTEIRWVPTRERDKIIVEYTVNKYLRGLSTAIRSLVAERLSELAQGSAIWVKLTVELIQKRKIHAISPMKTFLADIPSPAALSQLYAKLFAHLVGGDPDNERLASNALDILAVARRPLSILELGWALAVNDLCAEVRTVVALQDYVDEKRALSLLQPFLSEIDEQDVKKHQVKLVHHSLKELILRRDVPADWAQSQDIANERRLQQRHSKLEAGLLHVCVKYLLLDEFDQKDIFSEEEERVQDFQALLGFGMFDDSGVDGQQQDSSEMSQSRENKQQTEQLYYDPSDRGFGELFVYASCFWPDHLRVSAPELLPDTSDIVTLCRAKSKRLQNWTGQNCRPDCTVLPKFHFDSDNLDPLVIVTLYGSEIALKKLLQDQDVGSMEFLNDSVGETIREVIRRRDTSRLSILFRDSRVGPRVQTFRFFCDVMGLWAEARYNKSRDSTGWVDLFDLVADFYDELIQEELGNELLCAAASYGCLPIVERLFKEAAHNPAMRNELLRDPQRDTLRPDHHQSVGEAVWNDHIEVLRYLLQQDGIEVHLRHRGSSGLNVFHKAARYCNPDVISLLISHFREGADKSSNHSHHTPLSYVVFTSSSVPGSTESARILLMQGGADVRAGYTDEPSVWYEPLRVAARSGDAAMCRVLVEAGGANPRSVLKTGDDGRPSLIDHVSNPSVAVGSEVLDTLCSLADIHP